MEHILVDYVAHGHLRCSLWSFFLQIRLYNLLISFYLCRYFEEVFLVNDKVPVVGQHVAEIVWDFNLVPDSHNLTKDVTD